MVRVISYLQNRLLFARSMDNKSEPKEISSANKAKTGLGFSVSDQSNDQEDGTVFDGSNLFSKDQLNGATSGPYTPHF